MQIEAGKGPEPKFSEKKQTQMLLSIQEEALVKKSTHWTVDQWIELYIGILSYCLENPMYSLSWSEWKPAGYYPYLEQHMNHNLMFSSKNLKQIKTKDQNLKKKYFVKAKKPIDLMEHVFLQAQDILKKRKKILKSSKNDISQRLIRLEAAYSSCLDLEQSQLRENSKPYEMTIRSLMAFSNSASYLTNLKEIEKILTQSAESRSIPQDI